MAEYSRLALTFCPTSVAVHDNSDVCGHSFGIDRVQQFAFGRIGFYDARKILFHSLTIDEVSLTFKIPAYGP